MSDDSSNKVIIDNGSGVIKAGFCDRDTDVPSVKFPAIIGKPKAGITQLDTSQGKDMLIGDEADKNRGILDIEYPTKFGLVENWDDMERIWEYLYNNELRVQSADTYTMLTEAPRNPKRNREMMCEKMFEKFHVIGFYVAVQAVLSLYSNGRTTGVVCDSGDGVSHTVPVFEGFCISNAIKRNEVAGRTVTDHLAKLFEVNIGKDRVAGNWREIMREIKEKPDMCYISLDILSDTNKATNSTELDKSYEMPDGNIVNLNIERFAAPEILFDPSAGGKGNTEGLHKMCQSGSSLFKNLPERLSMEMIKLCPKADLVKVIAPESRYYSVWSGGNILAGLATFDN